MAKFVKGQSGNPSGRPKNIGELAAYARSLLPEVFGHLATIVADPSERGEVRCKAAKIIAERGMGAIISTVQLDSPTGVTITQLPPDRTKIEEYVISQLTK